MTIAPTSIADIARDACAQHHASQRSDELEQALNLVTKAADTTGVVVEIGCDAGGTLYAWRQVCHNVYGITLADNSYGTGGQDRPLVDHGATVHVGDSHDPDTLKWLTGQLDDLDGVDIDVLVIDGDHHVDGVLADLRMYGPLVGIGGLILLHDIAVDADPRAEVWKVWPGLVANAGRSYRTWEIRSQTQTPFGWGVIQPLRRWSG